jgi:hypothetical protein
MIYGARSDLGWSETAHRFTRSARWLITRIKRPPPATRTFRPKSGTRLSIDMAGTLSTPHPACRQPPQTLGYPHLRWLSRPVAPPPLRLRREALRKLAWSEPLEPVSKVIRFRGRQSGKREPQSESSPGQKTMREARCGEFPPSSVNTAPERQSP